MSADNGGDDDEKRGTPGMPRKAVEGGRDLLDEAERGVGSLAGEMTSLLESVGFRLRAKRDPRHDGAS